MISAVRWHHFALLAVAAVLTPILIFGAASWRAPRSPAEHAWERWAALGLDEQRARVQRFHKLMARGDSAELLRRAAAFAALPPEMQQRLAEVDQLRREFLARQTPADQTYLLGLPPEARAFEILRRLRAQDPKLLPKSARELLAQR